MNKLKYLVTIFILTAGACGQVTTTSQVASTDNTSELVYDLNLGPKGGGSIDPKITSGQAIINFKEGDGVFLFNINLKGKSNTFTTKDTSTTTSNGTTTITVTPSVSPTATPSPEASAQPNSISKISNSIYINNKKYLLDIPSDKVNSDKYTLNLAGLKKGSIVSIASEVYDSQNQSIGKDSLQNKVVKEDVESFDLNISLKIEINVEQKTQVTVTQSQVVSPVINIIIPAPTATPTPTPTATTQSSQLSGNQQQPPPPPPQNNNVCGGKPCR